MGAGLPSAIAASIVYPDRKVMAICGDGGFMMNSQELETAVRLKVNITVIILRDDAYGMIKWKQENMGFKRGFVILVLNKLYFECYLPFICNLPPGFHEPKGIFKSPRW